VDPEEGLDAAQLGSIYHEILETLYRSLDVGDRVDPDRVLAALPVVAGNVLDEAPRRQGFRETAWWRQTRQEIVENVARTVQALAQLPGEYIPLHFEARFFGSKSLKIVDGTDQFRLHGVIDRVDGDPRGRLRVIDYKLASPYRYSKATLERGEKLQLPLYALAAGEALGLGQPADGFYWHIVQAQASGLQLAEYGAEQAIGTAVSFAWEAVRGARQGDFQPRAPSDGCPSYCPAVAFCWQYKPGSFR
jgi:ATP-dependent helicase/DNAse subunit B